MTRSTSSTLVNLTHLQMLPSQPQLTGKRKPEDSNPLLNAAAAKRAKKEAKLGASNKRKLNPEEGPGGLLIVRATESQPPQSQPLPSKHVEPQRFASQPPNANNAGPSKQPSKKFKAVAEGSSRGTTNSKSKSGVQEGGTYSDEEQAEKDVRAMEDEADSLRRNFRAQSMIPSSILNADSSLQFRSRTEPSTVSRGKGKEKIIDTVVPLPDNDTPTIDRNKQLRSGAMAAITGGSNGNHARSDHRRRSSVSGRGKRVSTSFETTGIIVQPHNSVSENSFYKHIDADLPEPERVRQLLIWCSLRAASTSKPPSAPPSPPLPPLSAEGTRALKTIQDDIVRMLAEKRIDVNTYSSGVSSSKKPQDDLQENEQNLRNRQWEVTYTQHIQQAQKEEEGWNKISYEYDAYAKKLKASLEKRSAGIHLDPGQLSAKAKGKRRATGELADLDLFVPHELEVPPEFHSALRLANSVVGHSEDRTSRKASMEAEIKARLGDMQYKVDQIFSYVSVARTTVNIAEKALNERFDILSSNLASRMNPVLPQQTESIPGPSTQMLSTYVRGDITRPKPDPLDLMRALSRVDRERPPALVGDAARRAAREVQRAEENGAGAVGDRRLTLPPPATPSRKTPGTPRRGNTPSRDRA